MAETWMLVGLGNPGDKYAKNRHNIGFMAVDEICHRHNFTDWKKKFKGVYCDGQIDGHKVYLLKPATYMNLSGESVLAMASFFKIPPENIIVFYDELDLPSGKLRVKQGGGANGHNGLKSIDQHLGKNYFRVRLGIDHPGEKHLVSNYVLGDFAKSDAVWKDKILDGIGAEFPLLLQRKKDMFMTNIANIMMPDKKPSGQKT